MSRAYARVPRIQRLEYLTALLCSYKNDEFNKEQAQRAVQQKINDFEIEKAKALGRQRPRIYKGSNTLQECLYLATQLRLIDSSYRLTPDASRAIDPVEGPILLLERMWQIYPRFRQMAIAVRDAEQLDLPLHAHEDDFRQASESLYNLDFDSLTFETIRDLATQLGLINWYPTAKKRQIVYPAASVATLTEITCLTGQAVENQTFAQQCCHQTALDFNLLIVQEGRYKAQIHLVAEDHRYVVLQTESDQVFIRSHNVAPEDFEQVLWREYLALSNMRSQFPVLYPELRNKVCAARRISDTVFNQQILSLIRQPRRLHIYPSGGVLNYAANLAHLGKFLPPKTAQGNFIIYLKIERKNKQ